MDLTKIPRTVKIHSLLFTHTHIHSQMLKYMETLKKFWWTC